MLQSKDIKSIDELKKYFSGSERMVDHLVDLLQFFEFKSIYKRLNVIKKRGYNLSNVFSVFIILPFLHHASVHALLKSGSKSMVNGGKDVYYRAKNRQDIAWQELLVSFVKRFIKIVATKGQEGEVGRRCLIIDDSLLPKTGRKIEFVSKLWDHVSHRSLLGLRLLLLCYYDGKSTLPVDFSIHREKGKNEAKPYGLTKKQMNQQFHKQRTEDSNTGLFGNLYYMQQFPRVYLSIVKFIAEVSNYNYFAIRGFTLFNPDH